MRVLVTRPGPQGERTAVALRASGHEAVLAPLLHIEPLAAVDVGAGPWAAVLITSANAVRFLATHPRRAEMLALHVLAVGARSAQAAREAGFANVQSAGGDAQDLVRLVQARINAPGPLLYLAGEVRSVDVAAALAKEGYRVDTVAVYRAHADACLPRHVAQALRSGMINGVLHFSRRSAQTFLDALAGSGIAASSLTCNHFCLSRQVAEPLERNGVAHILIALRPDEAAVLDLVGRV
ncbi:MAG TPA: uroporphyrinogen-III synthase [Xanthobacteraceae bacterium]|nr:uroporphyrinogen-III synthase [Xanthobacteraceae bacterium]